MEPLPSWRNQSTLRRYVLEYKRAILEQNAIPIFMELLVVPLSLVGSSRSDGDTAIIEIVLCLFRNLLQVSISCAFLFFDLVH